MMLKYPSGLPQDKLRLLADTLERIKPYASVHDVHLARVLAEVLDNPRRDKPLDTATIEVALQLIADMELNVIEGGEV